MPSSRPRRAGPKQHVIGTMFGFCPMTCTVGPPDPGSGSAKKITGTTLRFLPSYLTCLGTDFPCPAAVQGGARPKQQVIGMMFGFLPNDLSARSPAYPGLTSHDSRNKR